MFHLAAAPTETSGRARRLGPIDAFTTLVENTYRGVLLDGLDRRTGHFELASRAAGAVQVVRVTRPTGPCGVEELADLVVRTLEAP